jgi:hypothetical protein
LTTCSAHEEVEAAVPVPVQRRGTCAAADVDALEGVVGPSDFHDAAVRLALEESHLTICSAHEQVEVAIPVPIQRQGACGATDVDALEGVGGPSDCHDAAIRLALEESHLTTSSPHDEVEVAVLVPVQRRGPCEAADVDALEGVVGPSEFHDAAIQLALEETHPAVSSAHDEVEVFVLVPVQHRGTRAAADIDALKRVGVPSGFPGAAIR